MTRREWWNGRWTLPLAALATAVPLLWPRIPPLADVPGHMASYHVSTAIDHSVALQRFFAFHWQLVGNLGVDLAVVPLSALFGVELATKLVVLAIPMLTALGLLLIARTVHGRLPATVLAALPLTYNYPFIFGFVNYSLSAALALLSVALWLRWPGRRHPALRMVAFAVLAIAIWLSHAIGWLMLGAMCGAAELARRRAAGATWLAASTSTFVMCLCLLAPVVLIVLGPHADQSSTSGWFVVYDYAKAVATILRDRWPLWDLASLGFVAALVTAALFKIGGLRFAPLAGWPAIVLFMLFLLIPFSVNGSTFVNTRIVPYALALAVIAIDTDTDTVSRPRQAMLAAGAALFFAARLAGNTASFMLYDASYTRELAALDHIPRGASVLNFTQRPCQKRWNEWGEHRLEHLAGMATVRRDAFVNVLWDIKGLHLLGNRVPQAGFFRSDPSEFVSAGACYASARQAFATVPSGVFTHLWLIGVPPMNRPHDARLVPVWLAGDSVLYRITAGGTAIRP